MKWVSRIWKEIRETFFRRHWRRYDFFDGSHRAGLTWEYLRGAWRKDWAPLYEAEISRFAGVPHAVTFASGRMSLYAILEALGIGDGDEVVVPAFTCVVVPNAVLYRGATPVYSDIEIGRLNATPETIASAISPRTKAILAQHTLGQPCDIRSIKKAAESRGIPVIEDCAHAFGGLSGGKPLGSFGDAAFVSTDRTKVLSTCVGGFALCSSGELTAKLRAIQKKAPPLPWHAKTRIYFQYLLETWLTRPRIYWLSKIPVSVLGRLRLWFYYHDELATRKPSRYPSRLSNFQAFLGWHEMKNLSANVFHRRWAAGKYKELFQDRFQSWEEGVPLRYSLLVKDPSVWEDACGKYVTVGRWFSSIAHGRTSRWDEIRYQEGSCPKAEYAASHVINFPTHERIDENAFAYLKEAIEAGELGKSLITDYEEHSHQSVARLPGAGRTGSRS